MRSRIVRIGNSQGVRLPKLMIEQAGLKNTRYGQAEVSDRHANFIIAEQGASSQDILKLIELVRERVVDKLGIELETEIEIW